MFRSKSTLLKTFYGHTRLVTSIDYSTFDCNQFICSGSDDCTVRLWDIEENNKIQLFHGHSSVNCVKYSPYHYYNNSCTVICFSSNDKTIRFWDIKGGQKLRLLDGHTGAVCGIEFSPFNGGRYLCSGSCDNTIRLWDVETFKSLHAFNGHTSAWCVDISPLQSNNNNKNESSDIGVIGGNGYTICSGSWDKTIRIWDIETTKQTIVFKRHEGCVLSVKYGPNELGNIGCSNTILSGSTDESVRLWDIRSGQQIQVFNGHTDNVNAVEYSPLVTKHSVGNSNVICSGSQDNTIRFWDIRSNYGELHVIKRYKEDIGITCLKFLKLKKDKKSNNHGCDINLCYGSNDNTISIWG
ncbi:G-protein beta WD-40 repeats containing protein [Reticulomyxa filosa]|uniref:G-protein beta WD-40 repeats containing protein n=1 Tax=Reticulomyxa filosa TaxID=46433 RepID=X6MC76_RETFI|nr:G-protein beta WD-40 repeats containing protein [Reticulomyxa filosa]|eukprot:ETO11042.1 G-protein beta WD-40 repeats containing protein [Reticulomyxa filosa]